MTTKAELKKQLDKATAVMGWCLKSEAAARINAMLDLARSEPGIPVLPGELDQQPWLLNCANGTLDLQTGQLHEHRRQDMLTQLCPTEYHADAPCPTWELFLRSVFQADDELITFAQRLCGYCLTGTIRDHVLPIFWGAGANGKSTLLNAIIEMLGRDYAMKAPPDLLMARRGETHPTERADLFGRRLVICSETPEARRMNEALVKDLTGGEPIRARRMREDFWEFLPTHKVILCTNHRPVILGTDEGIWRRLRLVPFEVRYWSSDDPANYGRRLPEELRQDKMLPEKLRHERAGILAWCVRGCLGWQRDGLTLPEKVRAATTEYRSGEDLLAQFLADRCLIGTEYRCRFAEVYASYRQWSETGGEKNIATQRRFGEALVERGFERYMSDGTWYRGVTVRDSEGTALPS